MSPIPGNQNFRTLQKSRGNHKAASRATSRRFSGWSPEKSGPRPASLDPRISEPAVARNPLRRIADGDVRKRVAGTLCIPPVWNVAEISAPEFPGFREVSEIIADPPAYSEIGRFARRSPPKPGPRPARLNPLTSDPVCGRNPVQTGRRRRGRRRRGRRRRGRRRLAHGRNEKKNEKKTATGPEETSDPLHSPERGNRCEPAAVCY